MIVSKKVQNNLWLLLILLFGAGSLFWGLNTIEPSPLVPTALAGDMLSYVDAKAGFTVAYPATWQVDYENANQVIFQQGDTKLFIFFDSPEEIDRHLTTAAYLNSNLGQPPLTDQSRKVYTPEKISFAGGDILRMTWGNPEQPYLVIYHDGRAIVRNQLAFILTVQPSKGQKLTREQVQALDEIVQSVTLLPIQPKHTEPAK